MKLITSSLLLVTVAACGGPRDPNGPKPGKAGSLVEIIEGRTNDFPSTHRVAVPLSGRNSLGSSVDPLDGRRISPRYNDCFFVVEQTSKGVDKITQTFEGSTAVKTEFAAVAASIGGELKSEDEVTVTFNGITVFGGYGIPNLTAPCGTLENGTKIQVVTEQIRAASAKVQFSHSYIARAKAAGGVSKVSGSVAAGWQAATEGSVMGKDIVLTGRVDEVQITVENADDQAIPDDVKPGTAFELPKSVRNLGSLVVQATDVSQDSVTVRFQPNLSATLEVDPAKASSLPKDRCAVGEDKPLKPNQNCVFWLAPGNAALVVRWVRTPDGKRQLKTNYYRTTMEPVRAKVASR